MLKKSQKTVIEFGRSMVEMLGVLMLVGVLSIAATVGYQYAMNKYRSNDTINEMNLRVVEAAKQYNQGRFDIVDELGNITRQGYAISVHRSAETPDYFEMTLDNVTGPVCRQLLKSGWAVPQSMSVGGVQYMDDESMCGEENAPQMLFRITVDLNAIPNENEPETTEPENPCGPGQITDENGDCHSCSEVSGFKAKGDSCMSACSNRFVDADGLCISCNSDLAYAITPGAACMSVCANRVEDPLQGPYYGCVPCNFASTFSTAASMRCDLICPNRLQLAPKTPETKYTSCSLCSVKSDIYVGPDGRCEENCPNRFKGLDDKCYRCVVTINVEIGPDGKCSELCPNRVKVGNYCNLK